MTIQGTHAGSHVGITKTEYTAATSCGGAPISAMSRLTAWAERGVPGEQRDVAVQKILLCWERGEVTLNLSGLGLKMQPPLLPPHVASMDFSGNNFTRFSLALPPNLKSLNLSHNELQQFTSPLPQTMRSLDLSRNALPTLETKMSSELEELNLESNQFHQAPGDLPFCLKILNLKSNLLEQFPRNLPSFLEGVDVRGNKITDLTFLPDYMLINIDGQTLDPQSRTILAEYRNAFETFVGISGIEFEHEAPVIDVKESEAPPQPAARPASTTSDSREMEKQLSELLDRIEILSADLPVALMAAVAAVPEQAPMTATEMLPMEEPMAVVVAALDEVPMAVEAAAALEDIQMAPVAAVPDETPMATAPVPDEPSTEVAAAVPVEASMMEIDDEPIIAPPLSQSVAAWYPLARRATMRRAWDKIEKQAKVKAEPAVLSNFLVRLYQTVNKDVPGFKEAVRALVEQALKSPSLLEKICNIAIEGTTSCEDRVSVSFQEMQKAALAERALKGEFNGGLLKLIDLGRQAYRDEKLQEVAEEIVKEQLNFDLKYYAENPEERQKYYPGMADDELKEEILTTIDPIGVYLLLRLQALDQLAVNSSVQKMRFPPNWLVTPKKVKDAVSSIKASENKEFSPWLSRWTPWKNTLSKVNKTKYAQATKKLDAQVSDPDLIKKKVDAKLLSEYGITPDSPLYHDSYQLTAPAITTQMREEIEIPLSLEFLKLRGMSRAVAPVWRTAINPIRLSARTNPLSIRQRIHHA